MNYSLKTNPGKRKDNQDYTETFFNQSGLLLAILCDGLGGHQAGDIASEMAVSQIGNAWENTDFSVNDTYIIQRWLNQQINEENTRIFEAASKYSDLEGMGTTLVACVLLKEDLLFANVGDSRAYIYKDEAIQLVTEDHTFARELQRRGELSAAEALNHVKRNALIRSLGVSGDINVDFFKESFKDAELVLLNSDGVSNVLSETEMITILKNKELTLNKKAEKLIEQAIHNDASDNITVNLVAVNVKKTAEEGEYR